MAHNEMKRTGCVGCGACLDVCPRKANRMSKDEYGFLQMEKSADCIECGLCMSFCQSRERIKESLKRRSHPITYAVWAKDKMIHRTGNSGGMFLTFAKTWIKKGGVVAAPIYDEQFTPRYICAHTYEQLEKQAWSKFVQSETGNIFNEIRDNLSAGTEVLFVGAPCQVKGLYAYLGSDNEHLLTIQFPCIGMPPQWFYQSWLRDFAGCELSQIQDIYGEICIDDSQQRYMKCILKDGTVVTELAKSSRYILAWNSFLTVSDVCCECRDNIAPVCADMTWGNFWYLGELEKFEPISVEDINNGCSMLLIHSEKGDRAFDEIKNSVYFFQRTYKEALTGHTMLYSSAKNHFLMGRYCQSERRAEFRQDMKNKDYQLIKNKFFADKNRKNSFSVAAHMNSKTKVRIWRCLYYMHKLRDRIIKIGRLEYIER